MTTKDYASGMRPATIAVRVTDGAHPLRGAVVSLYHHGSDSQDFDANRWQAAATSCIETKETADDGSCSFGELKGGTYVVTLDHPRFAQPRCVEVHAGCTKDVHFELGIEAKITTTVISDNCQPSDVPSYRQGQTLRITLDFNRSRVGDNFKVIHSKNLKATPGNPLEATLYLKRSGTFEEAITLRFPRPDPAANRAVSNVTELTLPISVEAIDRVPNPVSGNLGVSMTRTETELTDDLALWIAIRNGTEALSFANYLTFMDSLFCPKGDSLRRNASAGELFGRLERKRFLPFNDTDSYRFLKVATEAFVMVNCAVFGSGQGGGGPFGFNAALFNGQFDDGYLDRRDIPAIDDAPEAFATLLRNNDRMLPYLALIRRKLPDVPLVDVDSEGAAMCEGIVRSKLENPCFLELIWSYWQEEGMLVQSMNAVTRRFQNVSAPTTPDPLANLEIDPLRPLNNLIWGYTQDTQHRLTVNRRNAEYRHHYGLSLQGKAVQGVRHADSRSKFLEAFHHLLRLCATFYKQDDDTTIKADAFPVLNALKEVHLVLSQGAHNQFGDLPSTARIEMLMQQWLLARPEFREFLPTRLMVAYPEPWMDRVDAMKKLQSWTDTSVMHFRNLAIFGEQILLGIRYGNWSDVYEPTQAFNWARFFRPQVQGYAHAYRAATGVHLGAETSNTATDATLPSVLLQRRLSEQRRSA